MEFTSRSETENKRFSKLRLIANRGQLIPIISETGNPGTGHAKSFKN